MAGDDFSTRTLEEHRALIAEMLESSKEWPTDTHVLQASLTIAADTSEAESTRVEALILCRRWWKIMMLRTGSFLSLWEHAS